MSWIQKLNPFVWWRVRQWRSEDHMDCIMFMGACNLCRERLRYLGLPENPKPFYEWTPSEEPKPDWAPLPQARVVKKTWGPDDEGSGQLHRTKMYAPTVGRSLKPDECADCGKVGHCPHWCGAIGWCHECDGPDCGGGCRDDSSCPKRMHVMASGQMPWDLYPDEWTDEAIRRAGGTRA